MNNNESLGQYFIVLTNEPFHKKAGLLERLTRSDTDKDVWAQTMALGLKNPVEDFYSGGVRY